MENKRGMRSGKNRIPKFFLVLLVTALAACGQQSGSSYLTSVPGSAPGLSLTATLTPFQPERSNHSQSTSITDTPVVILPTKSPFMIWISPAVPDSLRTAVPANGFTLTEDESRADVRLDVTHISNDQTSNWIYAVVAPFYSTTDDVSIANIQDAWAGRKAGPFSGNPIWLTASTLAAFSDLWGAPANGAVNVAEVDQLAGLAKSTSPAWAIVPFEDLEPHWKVLTVDGQSPIHNDFNANAYGLKINFGIQPAVIPLPAGNRDPNKLTVLAMTGVTALVRGTADRMERKGVLYPGEQIRSILRSADLTHISNEVSFYPGCPTPDIWTSSLQFCSSPGYIALLDDIGVDIVELTGNHEMDYGAGPMLATIDMYDQRGWLHFGGGRDLTDATQVVKIIHNGNKLAFLGCNKVGPPHDWATETSPGAAPCDYEQMKASIAGLRSQGYLPVVTQQYNEYYLPYPTDNERQDFQALAEAGALIVSGSQGHYPATMEFDGGSFIHYGLGNLFFDQMRFQLSDGSFTDNTRKGFIDRHIFYNGRYVSTEILTYIIEDYAQPRPMTETERLQFLEMIFSNAEK
jgi:hypothetical protein